MARILVNGHFVSHLRGAGDGHRGGAGMRRAARVDANQPEIVAALRQVGASVQHLHHVGQGCPDILVGFQGINYLMEIKDGSKPPSRRRLTKDEADWFAQWNGQASIVENVDDALRVIGLRE
jgi:hypothetical protein